VVFVVADACAYNIGGTDLLLFRLTFLELLCTPVTLRGLCPWQNVEHLKDPSHLLGSTQPAAARRLEEAPTTATPALPTSFPIGTVHVILPFRGTHIDLLPSLLKNLGRLRLYTRDSFRLIISPVSWDHPVLDDVQERVQSIIDLAAATLDFSITLATPLATTGMSKQQVVDALKPFLDTKDVAKMPDNSQPVPAGVLPNPFIAAVIGALQHVPKVRSPVLLLDSATYSLSNDIVKKTLWRVINSKVLFIPISSAVASPTLGGLLLADGGVSSSLVGEEPQYMDAAWWADIEGALDSGDYSRRRVRRTHELKTRRAGRRVRRLRGGVNSQFAAVSTVPPPGSPTRKLMEFEGSEDDDFTQAPDQYGDYAYENLADDVDMEELPREWLDGDTDYMPELLEHEGYGIGEGYAEADDYHAYVVQNGDDDGEYEYSDDRSASDSEYDEGYDDDAATDDNGYASPFAGSFYDLLDVESAGEAQALSRVTTLGATKSDIATMLWWAVEVTDESSTAVAAIPEGDNCILLRMLTLARAHRYRIARTPMPGQFVDSKELSGHTDAETQQCSCNNPASSQSHCFLSLAQVWAWSIQLHCFTASLLHCFTASLLHCFTASLLH
jgi:hypothetical protein